MSLAMSMTQQGVRQSHLKQHNKHSAQEGWGSKSVALSRSTVRDAPTPQEHGSKHDSKDSSEKALYVTNSLEGWLNNENVNYEGMLLKRSPTWGDHQEWIDRVSAGGVVFGGEQTIQTRDDVWNGRREDLIPRLQEAGKELLQIAQERGGAFPEALGAQIMKDIVDIGTVVGALTSEFPSMQVKLEVQGHNVCERWHQDHYVSRAIVTYTGMGGTMYTDISNVDMWELENCGKNECVIHDKSKICSANVGDILFMKGKKYPKGKQGLVHKSAEKSYHSDGSIVNRLTLKIDTHPAQL
eukprot:TRINITY_DN2521_c0_g1_i5.p1 TRINITY_DN2521_c0_g1~~TRINITY_DN2521_c0_g1_i5.p1  ORF type:complete len:317 (-),score=37.42 TRINITY_DN2521_c0_g1_i5:679-1569(-)